MIKRIISLFCFCILTGCLYSCFEIKENIHINGNGSGSYSFFMDVSQLKPIFTMSRDLQRSMGDTSYRTKSNPPNPMLQMKTAFDALQPKIEAVAGISEYKTVCDTTAFILGATYSFATMEALNNSINVLRNSNGTGGNIEMSHYTYENKRFEKINDISKESISGSSSKNDSLTNELFKSARYTLTCTFDKKIKDVSNPLYFISADGKTLLYTGSLLDIINQKTNIGNAAILY